MPPYEDLPAGRRVAASPSPPLLEVRGLSVSYGDAPVLSGVDLEVREGGVTALVGPSGCGKSTLLYALNRLTGLIAGCRVTGHISVAGEDALAMDPVALRRRVGMIFQQPNPFPMPIRKNLALPLSEHGVKRREMAGRIRAALTDVGLWDEVADRLDAPAASLSGGQQQRLCLARALCLAPEILLLDEPTSSLDPIATATIEALILRLKSRYTIILVTHDLAQARRLADHVGLLWPHGEAEKGGNIVEFSPAERFFTAPQHPLTASYVNARTAGAVTGQVTGDRQGG